MAFPNMQLQHPSPPAYKVLQTFANTEEDCPGPRCGHTLTAVLFNLILFGGSTAVTSDGSGICLDGVTNSVHCLNVFTRKWARICPEGQPPSPRACHAAAASGRLLAILGGIGPDGPCNGDLHILDMTSDKFVWHKVVVQGETPGPRYGHVMGIADGRLTFFGGKLGNENLADAWSLDTTREPNVWERLNKSGNLPSASMSQVLVHGRSHHAAESVFNRIYVFGGITEGLLLDDVLLSDPVDNPQTEQANPSYIRRSLSESSLARLAEAHANLPTVENGFYAPLQQGAVERSNQRQLSSDQFMRPQLIRPQKSTQDLVKKVISTLLRPNSWEAPASRKFFLSYTEVVDLCIAAKDIIKEEPTLLQLNAPIKIFGDLHGQFRDMMRLFYEYGSPSTKEGDISYIDYLFLGDYVDRGTHSLEVIMLLLALKAKIIEYPTNIHLIRGNHESRLTNEVYGFKAECMERMGVSDGEQAWEQINILFNLLPLAALIEKKILCMHGGIGAYVNTLEAIADIHRPVYPDSEYAPNIVKDLLWSDPTENDSVLGVRRNARGKGVYSFGPDVVKDFCERNKVDMIVRAHECVLDGFERFAQGQLITVFSATNYCGNINNAGAILVIGRDLVVVPKLIHPLPPPISPSENSLDNTWMEVDSEGPPTPVRGGRTAAFEQGSTS
ncbi:unnamed protein product [Thlaspi arvense]|uniref:Serine/threonine-protein phosphatase n=1 Tax=Thlaspi arvense TaxID=13288 RepID=A0AAU9REX9_THLAR|nr:unnamed protein product [Thlaspi arvense]